MNELLNRVDMSRPPLPELRSPANSHKQDSFLSTSTNVAGYSSETELKQQTPRNDILMTKFIMVCTELERLKKMPARDQPSTLYKQEIARLHQSIKIFDSTIKEKEAAISSKDEQLRLTRQKLSQKNLQVTKMQVAERNRIRQLQNQLLVERSKSKNLVRRKEDVDSQLKQLVEKESTIVKVIAAYETKIASLEQELVSFREGRTKIQADTKSNMFQLRRENQQLSRKIEEYKFDRERAERAELRNIELEKVNNQVRREQQEASSRVKMLEIQLNNQAARKIEHTNEQFQQLSTNLQMKQQEVQMKTKQLSIKTTEIDRVLREKEQLIKKMQEMSKVDQCKVCSSLKFQLENSNRKIIILEKSLLEKQNQLKAQFHRHHLENQVKTDRESRHYDHHYEYGYPSDILLSAKQIKGSTDRVNRLIDKCQDIQRSSTVRSLSSSRLFKRRY